MTADPAGRPAPTLTSFDFLTGGYVQAARSRLASLLVVGAVAAVGLLLVGQGLSTMWQVATTNARAAQARAQKSAQSVELAHTASVAGIGEPALQAEVTSRRSAAERAVNGELSTAQILAALQAAAASVPGAQLTSITLSSTTPTSQPSGPTTTAPATTVASGSAAHKASGPTLTVTLTVSSYTDVQAWTSALASRLPSLSDPVAGTTVSGGKSNVAVTTTGTLAASATTAHKAQVDEALHLPGVVGGAGQ